jgi:hypothetical protein
MSKEKIIKLIKMFYQLRINKVFISDISSMNRLIEIFYNILNYKYITNVFKYLFNPNYYKIKYYSHNYSFLKKIPYKIKKLNNFNYTKKRYTILLYL